jgi:hypothetical protein
MEADSGPKGDICFSPKPILSIPSKPPSHRLAESGQVRSVGRVRHCGTLSTSINGDMGIVPLRGLISGGDTLCMRSLDCQFEIELMMFAILSDHHVPLPDEYDQIHRDLNPFRALRLQGTLSASITTAATQGGTAVLMIKDHQIEVERREGDDGGRVDAQLTLLEPIAPYIKDLRVVHSQSDTPNVFMSWEHRSELEECIADPGS